MMAIEQEGNLLEKRNSIALFEAGTGWCVTLLWLIFFVPRAVEACKDADSRLSYPCTLIIQTCSTLSFFYPFGLIILTLAVLGMLVVKDICIKSPAHRLLINRCIAGFFLVYVALGTVLFILPITFAHLRFMIFRS